MNNNILISAEKVNLPCESDRIYDFLTVILGERKHSLWEVSVFFCSDTLMQQYNKAYRHIDATTDVLSFEAGDSYKDENGTEWYVAGDIVISPQAIIRNSKEFGVSVNEELKRLLIHGILHLEGMDHGDGKTSKKSL